MPCSLTLNSYFLVWQMRKSVSTAEWKRGPWQDTLSGHCCCGVFHPHPPLKAHRRVSGGGTHTGEGSWDSCPWPVVRPHPSVPLFVLQSRTGPPPCWAAREQVARYTGPVTWVQEMGRRAETGSEIGVSAPGKRGSQLDLVPSMSQWAELTPWVGLSCPIRDPLLGRP